MEDKLIVDLYHARNEYAIVESEKKYGAYCRSIARNLLTLRVAIDEDGVTGVAYTLIVTADGAMPGSPDEVDFVVDRPFLFLITGADDVPLFAGVVNQP